MIQLADIIGAIQRDNVRISDHADEEAVADRLKLDDIYVSVEHGEIIKQYPDDKPYPSCLVLGKTNTGEPVHSVWAYNGSTRWTVLVTVYRPDPALWIDWRERRKPT